MKLSIGGRLFIIILLLIVLKTKELNMLFSISQVPVKIGRAFKTEKSNSNNAYFDCKVGWKIGDIDRGF